MTKLQGILPAVVTSLDSEYRFCCAAFERLLERVYEAGVHGLYVCGQTGEGLAQAVAQRKTVAEAAIRNSPPGKIVIVHVGAHGGTADAIDLARHAERIGATAISSLPPIGGYSFEEVHSYYSQLAAATDLPLLIYYYPALAPSIVQLDHFLRLCDIPKVAGLKFTDFNLYRLSEIKRSGAVVFNGCDEVLVAGLLMGADGGIGSFYNLVPELFVKIYGHATAGRWEQAREVQREINELIRIGLRYPVHPVVKKLLAWSGIDCGRCIPPRRSLSPEEEDELKRLLTQSRFADLPFAAVRA